MSGPVNLTQVRQLLAEKDARWLDRGDGTRYLHLVGDAEIQRVWTMESVKDYQAQMIEYLDLYTSADNSTAKKYVDNPLVDNEQFYGRWRQVEARPIQNGDRVMMLQVLRKGYIESLVSGGTLDYAEARMVERNDYPDDIGTGGISAEEDFIVLEWRNCSPYKAKEIVASIIALDPDAFAPTVRGESLGSSWHRQFVSSKIENDGSATITLFLCKPGYVLSAPRSWYTSKQGEAEYHWNVPKTIAQALIDSLRGLGVTITAEYNKQSGLVDLIVVDHSAIGGALYSTLTASSCEMDVYMSMYMDVMYPELYEIPARPPAGYEYTRDIQSMDGGLYDVRIIVSVRQDCGDLYGILIDTSCSSETEMAMYNVIKNPEVIDIPAAAQGVVYHKDIEHRRDGTYAVRLTATTRLECGNLYATIAESTCESNIYRSLYTNVKNPAALNLVSEPPYGITYNREVRNAADGTYDVAIVADVRKDCGDLYDVFTERSVMSETLMSRYTNVQNPTTIDLPAAVPGVMYRKQIEHRKDGTYIVEINAITKLQGGSIYDVLVGSSCEDNTIMSTYFGITDPSLISIPADAPQGVTYSLEIRNGQDGLYDVSVSATSRNMCGNLYDVMVDDSKASKTILSIYNSVTDASTVILPSAAQGIVYNKEIAHRRDGTYRVTIGATVRKECGDLYDVYTERGVMSETLLARYTNVTNPSSLALPAASPGIMYRKNIEHRNDGTYLVEISAITKLQGGSLYGMLVESSCEDNAYRSTYFGITDPSILSIPADPPSGVIYELEVRNGQEGLYDVTLISRLRKDCGNLYDVVVDEAMSSATELTVYNNVTDPSLVAIPSAVQGVIYHKEIDHRRDGTYRVTISAVERRECGNMYATVTDSSLESNEYRWLYTAVLSPNAIALPSSPAQGMVYSKEVRNAADGTYDIGVVLVKRKNNGDLADKVVQSSTRGIIYWSQYTNVTDPDSYPIPTSAPAGVIYKRTIDSDRDGTYSVIIQTALTTEGGSFYDAVGSSECDSIRYFSVYRSVPDPTYYQIPTSPDPGFSYDREVVDEEGGLYRIVVSTTVRQTRNYNWTKDGVAATENDYTYRQRGITDNAALIDVSTAPQGLIYNRSLTVQRDCSKDQDVSVKVSVPVMIIRHSGASAWDQEFEILYDNYTVLPEAPSVYDSVVSSIRVNADATYSGKITLSSHDTEAVAVFRSAGGADEDESTIMYRPTANPIEAPVAGVGGMYMAENAFSELAGTYVGRLVYRTTPTRSVESVAARSLLSEEGSLVYVGVLDGDNMLTDDFDPESDAQYLIYERSVRPGRNGTWDVVWNVRNNRAFGIGTDSMKSPFMQEITYMYENYPIAAGVIPSAPSVTVGRSSVAGRLGQDGKFTGAMTYEYPIGSGAMAAVQSGVGPLERTSEILYARSPAAITVPPSGQGGVYSSSQSLRDSGVYDGSITYVTSVPFSAGLSWADNEGIDYMYMYKNQTSWFTPSLPAYTTNTLGSVSVERDGTYSTVWTAKVNPAYSSGLFETSGVMSIYVITQNNQWIYYRERYCLSRSAAENFANGIGSPSVQAGFHRVNEVEDKKTTIDWLGRNKYRATRVELKD